MCEEEDCPNAERKFDRRYTPPKHIYSCPLCGDEWDDPEFDNSNCVNTTCPPSPSPANDDELHIDWSPLVEVEG